MSGANPCLSCGACCANFRVSFYWAEADDAPGGLVPSALTVGIGNMRSAMRGTESKPPRCCALLGEVGSTVRCSIYLQRPSPCREFSMAWEHGESNERCDQARLKWGMQPLLPQQPPEDRTPPKAA